MCQKNRTMNFVGGNLRKALAKKVAKTIKFDAAIDAIFVNISTDGLR